MPGVTIGVDDKVTITGGKATCTCGWTTDQVDASQAILVSEWHLKSHTDQARRDRTGLNAR